ncbi:MAG: dihydrofolate reductase [Algoriphagus aquaeductus]|uniref:Dihydrofolate reductase n=1 Tax=Algoriphagus aquaeductus TaxID=475299 RepID=A0A326RVW2_9BACT|nr:MULTISPECIES: dihydrofolate reductase [Algoriphagus]PZV81512.1 dihydrofolate reductase [Algoriphagus aquaeductus]
MQIILIAAVAKNKVIGKDNQLIWKLSADLKRFKNLTSGHFVLMGRKTFDSLGRLLPNRTHLIISRDPDYQAPENHFSFRSIEDAIIFCNKIEVDRLFIIGGGQIYQEAMPICDRLEITEVEAEPDGDTFFPQIDPDKWKETEREEFPADEKNEFPYAFVTYEKH